MTGSGGPAPARRRAPEGDDSGEEDALLNPRVLTLVQPTGEMEVRIGWIDSAAAKLELREVDFDADGEVLLGQQTSVPFADMARVVLQDSVVGVRCRGTGNFQLRFDEREQAQVFAQALQAACGGEQGGDNPESPAVSRRLEEILTAKIAEQEKQVQLMEQINGQKEAQLMKMHKQLEDALSMLSAGQQIYGEQQQVIDEMNRRITALRQAIEDGGPAPPSSNLNFAPPPRAAAAASAAPAAKAPSPAPSPKDAALAAATAKASPKAGAASSAPRVLPSPKAAASAPRAPAPAWDDEDGDEVCEEQALLEKLRRLEAEKAHFEKQLQDEQGSIAKQLRDMQSLMQVLGVSELGQGLGGVDREDV